MNLVVTKPEWPLPRHVIIAALLSTWPIYLPSLFRYARTLHRFAVTKSFITNAHCFIGIGSFTTRIIGLCRYFPCRFVFNPLRRVEPPPRTYATLEDEARYWRDAERFRSRIQDPRTHPAGGTPLVQYYTPTPPPLQRSSTPADPALHEYALAPRAFCKWHRMLFKGPLHPTLREAEHLIKRYSTRDRQMIARIARMATDEDVFGGALSSRRKQKYMMIWKEWLEAKGPDVAIVFE